MTFDPFGHISGQPPQQPQQPPDGTAPIPVHTGDTRPPDQAARERAMLPGVFLIVLGVLNALMLLLAAFNLVTLLMVSDEVLEEVNNKQVDQVLESLKKANAPPAWIELAVWLLPKADGATLKRQHYTSNGIQAVVTALGSLLLILGGLRMTQLRSYALAMSAAIFAAIPCLSVPGCCCIGQVVGIWAFIVLLGTEVRAAFR
jgi:hypothetical protein